MIHSTIHKYIIKNSGIIEEFVIFALKLYQKQRNIWRNLLGVLLCLAAMSTTRTQDKLDNYVTPRMR